MKELIILDKHLEKFRTIINVYKDSTKYPKPDNWKRLSNNEIWFWMVGQIMVVGSSGGGKRFWQSDQLKKMIDFDELQKKKNDKAIKKTIHYVLRDAGARYAAIELDKCAKTKALLFNFKTASEFKNGFKDLLTELNNMRGLTREHDRVYYLMENLKFMKNKSARDFLMNLGMNHNTLAIDIRIQNIFQHLKIEFPNQSVFGNTTRYEEIESQIITKVCKPLEINPLHFDRILYQNYFKILKDDYSQLKIPLY